ncbi:MAG: glycerate kinase [Desulfobacula sp.]|jgi:glycerate 2-kinase|uniref:glycerate kinase type-2 family protein n=1 Tax=Desulfobacula sp. TaxID=2593537 RepID=UPI001D505D2E|nr:glycerate kinase [Desulfobacula sp.]MBT3483770.1 glycerate kinase [Desulfobacula sp.]MBT3803452.1 glycerate kinase [Desulfobacula sp.]MBT4023247.1 glycerate kinase [Desulfobacula sp.]MBT4197233.1 glycerate kinase [Desulfobacula sp.]
MHPTQDKPDDLSRLRKDAMEIFQSGLLSADPAIAIQRHLKLCNNILTIGDLSFDLANFEEILVIGAGKASAAMAKELENIMGSKISRGIINVKYDHTANLNNIELIEAGHPIPDENGQAGAKKIFDVAKNAHEKTLIFCLISGGGSALSPLPCEGISLAEKQETTKILLSCGARIHEINTIRKHLSLIKGGGLAKAAFPATIISLILSDVVGDDLDIIASGLTVPDTGTFKECKDIIESYNIAKKLPKNVLDHINIGCAGKVCETPKPFDPYFKRVHNIIIGNNFNTLVKAKAKAQSLGYNTIILSSLIEGETREIAKMHSAIAKEILKTGNPVPLPGCIISGGETIVTMNNHGLGGRNQEFVLASAIEIQGEKNISALSLGTDGTDGPTDAAGAMADGNTLKRAQDLGVSAKKFLREHDSYHFFKILDDLIITGPTHTNVMDMRIFLIK